MEGFPAKHAEKSTLPPANVSTQILHESAYVYLRANHQERSALTFGPSPGMHAGFVRSATPGSDGAGRTETLPKPAAAGDNEGDSNTSSDPNLVNDLQTPAALASKLAGARAEPARRPKQSRLRFRREHRGSRGTANTWSRARAPRQCFVAPRVTPANPIRPIHSRKQSPSPLVVPCCAADKHRPQGEGGGAGARSVGRGRGRRV